MYASRNIRLCTKDCLCLFVCPTGATDTENGQIDKSRCLDGCRRCVDACPSHAISLVFENYPEPLEKDPELAALMIDMLETKAALEAAVAGLLHHSGEAGASRLLSALRKSLRITAEDCAREAGYMLPQCKAVRDLHAKLGID